MTDPLLTVTHGDARIIDATPDQLAALGVPADTIAAAQRALIVPPTLSRRQFFQQLAIDGDITEDEALAAVQSGAIPQKMAAAISGMSGLSAEDQFAAKMLIAGATDFQRAHPLVAQLGVALGKDAAGLDQIWIDGAKLL